MNFGKPQSQGSTSNRGSMNNFSCGSFKYGRGGRAGNNSVNYPSSTNYGNNSSGYNSGNSSWNQNSFGRGGSSNAFGEQASNSSNSNSFGRGGSSSAFGEKTNNSSNSSSFGRGGSSPTFGGQTSNSGNSFGRGGSSTTSGDKASNSNSFGRGGVSTTFRGQVNNAVNSFGRGGASNAYGSRANSAGNSFGRGGSSTAFGGQVKNEGNFGSNKIIENSTWGNKPDFGKQSSESINSSGFSQPPSNQIKGFDEPQTSNFDSLPRTSGFQPITTQQSNTSGAQPATMQQSNASADQLLLMETKIKGLESKIGEMDKQLKGVLASHEIAQNKISDLTKTIEDLVKFEKHRDSVQPEKVEQKLVSQDQLLDEQKSGDLNVSSGYESNFLMNQAEQGKQCSMGQAVQNSSSGSNEGQNIDLSRLVGLGNDEIQIDPQEAKGKSATESNIGQEKDGRTTSQTTAVEPKLPSYVQISDSHFVFESVHFSKYHKKINERGETVEGKLEIKAHEDKCQITFTPSDGIKSNYEFWIPFDFVQLFPVQDHLNTLMIIGYDEQHTYDSLRTFFASFPAQSDSQAFKNLCYGQLPNDSSL